MKTNSDANTVSTWQYDFEIKSKQKLVISDTLEAQYNELTEKYKQTQSLANGLQTQLAAAQAELAKWADEVNRIREELEEQIRILKNALENSEAERKICEDKWQTEFELLRTHNRGATHIVIRYTHTPACKTNIAFRYPHGLSGKGWAGLKGNYIPVDVDVKSKIQFKNNEQQSPLFTLLMN